MRDLRVTQLLPVGQIRPAGDNVREKVGDVRELANSIREVGLMTPLLVAEEGDHYILIAGHRRLTALRKLGWTEIPCVVRPPMNDMDRTALMLIENTQRVNIDPIEKAKAFKRMVDQGLTQTQVAERVGVSDFTINQYISLLTLPDDDQQKIREGKLSASGGYKKVKAYRRIARQASRQAEMGRKYAIPSDPPVKTKVCDKCGGTGELKILHHPHPECPNCTSSRLCFKHGRERAEADQQELIRLRAKMGLVSA